MLVPDSFVSARLIERGVEIEMEHESLSVFTFEEGPPYTPQIIELG